MIIKLIILIILNYYCEIHFYGITFLKEESIYLNYVHENYSYPFIFRKQYFDSQIRSKCTKEN